MTTPTATQVRAAITTSLTDSQIDAIVSDAEVLLEGCSAFASYSGAKQTAILKWVSAHLIASTNSPGSGSLTQKALGDANESYARPVLGPGMMGTTYGQQAIALDTSGCLANIGRVRSFMKVL